MFVPSLSLYELAIAIGVTLSLALIAVSLGALVTRCCTRALHDDPLSELVVATGVGLVAVWLVVLVMGHLRLLSPAPTVLAGVIALAAGWTERLRVACWMKAVWALARGSLTRRPMFALPCLAMTGLLVYSGTRPPGAQDELDYHWTAPVAWAAHGGWEDLPLRFTSGLSLSEHLYTVAAVFRSPTAAHWIHLLFFLVLALGAAALARRFGGSGLLASFVVLSVPVLLNQASLAYNDVAFAALLLCAAVVLFRNDVDWKGIAVAGALLGGAYAVKPIAALFMPALLVGALSLNPTALQVRRLALVALPVTAVLVMGVLHTLALTGQPLPDSSGFAIKSFSEHPLATGRIPVPADVAIVPVLPLLTSVGGQNEPYGGRTGLAFVVALPMIVAAAALDRRYRSAAKPILLAVALAFLPIAVIFVRTRFHGLTWALLAAATGVVVSQGPTWCRTRVAYVLLLGAGVAGMADAARIVVRPWT